MRLVLTMALLAAALGGCSGEYILTVPDQVAAAGGEANVVMRLQRNEFAGVSLAIKDACIRFQIEQGPVRGSFTDDEGYAAAPVPAGNVLGKYYLHVSYMDYRNGREAGVYTPVFVWDPRATAYAVDLDALPMGGESEAAAAAVNRLASNAYVVYFTRQPIGHHESLHQKLRMLKYPDGPVQSWQVQAWRMEKDEKYHIPRLIVENRLVSPLTVLRRQFPNLKVGLCTSRDSARAFMDAGLKVILVGREPMSSSNVSHFESWDKLPASF